MRRRPNRKLPTSSATAPFPSGQPATFSRHLGGWRGWFGTGFLWIPTWFSLDASASPECPLTSSPPHPNQFPLASPPQISQLLAEPPDGALQNQIGRNQRHSPRQAGADPQPLFAALTPLLPSGTRHIISPRSLPFSTPPSPLLTHLPRLPMSHQIKSKMRLGS